MNSQALAGQVREFNVYIQNKLCSARLSRAHVSLPAFADLSVRDRKKGGPPALAGTREYEQSWNR